MKNDLTKPKKKFKLPKFNILQEHLFYWKSLKPHSNKCLILTFMPTFSIFICRKSIV